MLQKKLAYPLNYYLEILPNLIWNLGNQNDYFYFYKLIYHIFYNKK